MVIKNEPLPIIIQRRVRFNFGVIKADNRNQGGTRGQVICPGTKRMLY
jgi:hypothetical protein